MNRLSQQDFLRNIKNSYREFNTILAPLKKRVDDSSYLRMTELKNFISFLIAVEEDVIEMRLKKIIDEENPYLPAIDAKKLRQRNYHNSSSLKKIIDTFLEQRLDLVKFLQAIPSDIWNRTGVHELEGHVTFEEFIRRILKNDQINIAHLRKDLVSTNLKN